MAAAPALRLPRPAALLLPAGLILNVDAVADPTKSSPGTALLATAVASLPSAQASLRGGPISAPLLPFGTW